MGCIKSKPKADDTTKGAETKQLVIDTQEQQNESSKYVTVKPKPESTTSNNKVHPNFNPGDTQRPLIEQETRKVNPVNVAQTSNTNTKYGIEKDMIADHEIQEEKKI